MNIISKNDNKDLLVLIQSPADTKSGYGHHSRSLIKSLFQIFPSAEFKFINLRWGNTPFGALDPNNSEEKKILDNVLTNNYLRKKPDIFIQISVPNEFQRLGNFNIGITAGMETDVISAPWIDGSNRMNLIIVPSKHSANGFLNSHWDKKNQHTGQIEQQFKFQKPIEVLFEGIDTNIYKQTKEIHEPVNLELEKIKSDFNFLFVGHWLAGKLGQDRKDVGMLIKTFLETFADFDDKPGLILKTSHATTSIIDREMIFEKIDSIKELIYSESPRLKGHLPEIYLLHGDLTNEEMNSLYNHPKIKAFVTFTKGEGYGRPIAEFSTTGKPILVSKCSGQLDFLNPLGITFLNGKYQKVDKSAVWKDVIVPESSWFTIDYNEANIKMRNVFRDYGNYLNRARQQRNNVIKNFSQDKMTERFKEILDKYVPKIPEQKEVKLPILKKVNEPSKIEFPKLKKVEEFKENEEKNENSAGSFGDNENTTTGE